MLKRNISVLLGCKYLISVHTNFWFMLSIGQKRTNYKITETIVVASNKTGLEVNADETKYTVMSREQNAG